MNKNLGKFILLFLLTYLLQASEYEWSLEVNKKEAHINEAIHLHYVCKYSDSAELYVIEFNPSVDNKDYKIEILREDEKIVDGKKINEYDFVLFVKKSGKFTLALDTLMKKTNKDSIENGMLGRDNANYEEFSLYPYKQENIEVNILETSSNKVGVFTLSVRKDKTEIEAYEPYHLEFSVSGLGDFQVFKDVEYKIDGVTVFSEDAKEEILLTADGYKGTWKKKFAFVSDKSFTIPPWKTHYFDLKEKKMKTLEFKGVDIQVTPVKFTKEQLLDPIPETFTFDRSYIYYIFTFLAGFLLAKIKFTKQKTQETQKELFCKRIHEASSLEKLSFILVNEDAKKYEALISQIELKELKSLKKVKNLICG
ncbi:BatD family protein [Sulfurimonas sp. SAG-AH-194-L11]|nr:hypothetical protein [Sulfurimonas sp. SAG-AH-194-L11]MDF1876444.1 BatD family protein [Sulfurimonas sp. SAG-AH-194-L11]